MKKILTFFILFLAGGLIYPQIEFSDATDYRLGDKFPLTQVDWVPYNDAAGDWCQMFLKLHILLLQIG